MSVYLNCIVIMKQTNTAFPLTSALEPQFYIYLFNLLDIFACKEEFIMYSNH